jgi:hypothetical protein
MFFLFISLFSCFISAVILYIDDDRYQYLYSALTLVKVNAIWL